MAQQGLRVVPTVNWGTKESFDFCFSGIEKGSIVAVSTYMFHEHGNHADQKELFLNGYRELLKRIEPEYVICYSEPFPEMEGNLIYIDYEMSSWRHMNDDIKPAKYIKHIHSMLTETSICDIIIKIGYICKGGGSAFGGDRKPKYHSNPHDHHIDWSNGHPNPQSPINYWDGNIPEFKNYYKTEGVEKKMKFKDMPDNPSYNPDDYKFETLGEFKFYLERGWNVGFEYNGEYYGIEGHNNSFYIWIYDEDTIAEGLTIDETLDFKFDGVKLRDLILDATIVERLCT